MRIIAEDPNPGSNLGLQTRMAKSAEPVVPIQEKSDTGMLNELRVAQARFNEKKRVYDLSRQARLLADPTPNHLKVRILRPRSQLIGQEKRVLQAYVDFVVEAPATARGLDLKRLIRLKQEALLLPTTPLPFMLLFLHELGGASYSPFIGRELLAERGIREYGIEAGLTYDVTVWQNQTSTGARQVATLLLVDARPGGMLPEQIAFIDDCREKESPCYTGVS